MKTSRTSIIFIIVLLLLGMTLSEHNLSWLKKKETQEECKEDTSSCLYNSDCCSNYCKHYRSGRGSNCNKR